MNQNELYHFGIKGMKWGIRRFQDKNGRLTNAGKKRYSDDSNDTDQTENTKKRGLTDKQKKYIKIGAAAAITALAVYGGYKLYQNRDLLFNKSIGDLDFKDFDQSLGFKKISKKTSIMSDIKNINPNFSPYNRETSMNCGNCTLAFEMRRRGYDVSARGNSNGMKISHFGEFFTGLKSESFIQFDPSEKILQSSGREKGSLVKDLISSNISKQYKDNASGALFFPHTYGAHWINWVKEGSSVKFYDGQNPNIDLDSLFSQYTYRPNNPSVGLTSIRLDDLKVNPSITRMVSSRSNKTITADFNTFIDKGSNWVSNWMNLSD